MKNSIPIYILVIVVILLLISVPVLGENKGNLVFRSGVNGIGILNMDVSSWERDLNGWTSPGPYLAAEYLYNRENIQLGAGGDFVSAQSDREDSENFSFLNLYVLTGYNYPLEKSMINSFFLRLRTGYGFYTPPLRQRETPRLKSEGGIYFNTGVGLSYDNWELETKFAFNQAVTRDLELEEKGEISYYRMIISLGYVF